MIVLPEDTLADLGVSPVDIPAFSATARSTLIAYLLRWEQFDAARRCLEQLLVTHSRAVSVYDSLARAYLGVKQPDRALEIMRRRHVLRISNSSRALEAQILLAAGHVAEAQAIADELTSHQPDLLLGWSLQADVCLAAGDTEAAETALQRRDTLHSETAATAAGMARLWQARGDPAKALHWARAALSRTEQDGRQPSVELLRLLQALYATNGQEAQAEAIRARLDQQRGQDLEAVRKVLGLARPTRPPARLKSPKGDLDQPLVSRQPTSPPVDVPPDVRRLLETALHDHFPHRTFRPAQAEVIATVLRGESVLAVMPTGAGKSLCYQLASLLLPGLTLVISPLIALMKDQIDGLPDEVAARATTLNYTLDSAELKARLDRVAGGQYKLLYAAPERLRQRPFLHALKRAGVSLLVIDEAHCVSLWGHDFRPDYLFIAKAWQELGRPPILAMTATATPRVRDDIQAALGRMRLVATEVHRPNLRLEALRFSGDEGKQHALVALCRELTGSGIVYANARAKCEQLVQILRQHGVAAIHYHAGMDDRVAAQDRFMSGKARVVVATIAFGMGIDKPDVRFIVHYHPPRTLENYYQEAGRAGRDGLPARCILFYAASDKANLTRWVRLDALSVTLLRELYGAIQRRLGSSKAGLVALADLERDLDVEDTRLRVAVHCLELAGLLQRGFDLPRTAAFCLRQLPSSPDPDLRRFVEVARLRAGQFISRDLVTVTREAGLDLTTIEARLLAWSDAGWLDYRGIGRDMFLTLPPPPADARDRVSSLLAEYLAGQEGRIAEILAYASTRLCRHGYVSAYFGGRPMEHCQACDNCTGTAGRPIPGAQPISTTTWSGGPVDPQWAVLQGVAMLPSPLGTTGLARALKGLPTSPVEAERFALFGALAGLTRKGIGQRVSQMVDAGLLATFQKGSYSLLALTDKGRSWLETHEGHEPDPVPPAAAVAGEACDDEVLFERLRAWRLAMARELGKAPFVVFSDATLRAIVACRPATLSELATVKGIGSSKLERYGPAVLAIVSGDKDEPAEG